MVDGKAAGIVKQSIGNAVIGDKIQEKRGIKHLNPIK